MRFSLLFLAAIAIAAVHASPVGAQSRASAEASPARFDLVEDGVAQLQARMQDGTLSSHALTQAYLERIAAIDDSGPQLNAVIELNPDALDEADALDVERRAGRLRGPLHGIPMLLKDNIDATPMANSAGSLALAGHHPKHDAFLVQLHVVQKRRASPQREVQGVVEIVIEVRAG